jgi:hypothetical protein
MQMRASVVAGVVAAVLGAIAASPAEQPKISNAQVSVHGGSLRQEIAATRAPAWIGYSLGALHEVHSDWSDEKEYLEGNRPAVESRPVRKAGDPQPVMLVLLRVSDGKVGRVQVEDPLRELDGGGLPFVWLTEVSVTESMAAMRAVVESSVSGAGTGVGEKSDRDWDRQAKRVAEQALLVLALTDAPEATAALRGFTAASYPPAVRERAAFWLANERGREGFAAVSALLRGDGKTANDDAFREKLVFDLTLVRGEAGKDAVDELIAVAKTDASPKVRSQAQFWLAQQAGKKAESGQDGRILATLGDEARNDPEAAMRKSAVFALSRLPEEQGVPELIQVASTAKDAATRREAIFWLGRAKDPRALAYLEKVVRE